MASDRKILRLVSQHAAARSGVSKRLQGLITRLYRSNTRDAWYQPKIITAQAQRAAQYSRQAQIAQANMTAKYLNMVLAEFDGVPTSSLQQDVRTGTSSVQLPERLREVDPIEMWERPASTFRWNDAEGVEGTTAEDRAVTRAVLLADMDMQLADREATRQVLEAISERTGVITGHRRIIHPELSKGGTCGLCIAAADRVYNVSELRPVHERCFCTEMPVVDGEDPGLVLNQKDIAAIYKAAGSTSSEALKRIKFQVVQHGELGPVLRLQGNKVRTAEEASENASERIDVTPWSEAASVETRRQKRQTAVHNAA